MALKFRLEIEIGSDTIQDGEDVADALYRLSKTLDSEIVALSGLIRDTKGNAVGKWDVRQ